jgi:hypothetical protein
VVGHGAIIRGQLFWSAVVHQLKHEMQAAPSVDQPSAFWKCMGEINEQILGWSGYSKRTLDQNYLNFVLIALGPRDQ